MTTLHATISETQPSTDFLNSLPAAVEAPVQQERRPRIDLKFFFSDRFPNWPDCMIAPRNNHEIRVKILGAAISAARKRKEERYKLAADLLEVEVQGLQARLDSYASALLQYAKLDPGELQRNWTTGGSDVVNQLLSAIDLRDPEHLPFSQRAHIETTALAERLISNMPAVPAGNFNDYHAQNRTMGQARLEDHLLSCSALAKQQGVEAWLEVGKRYAAWEALVLDGADAYIARLMSKCPDADGANTLLRELFIRRAECYTQNNRAYLAEQAQVKAEADAQAEEERLAAIEAVEGPIRRAAEEAAASAAGLRERFDVLLTGPRGPAFLKALERLASKEGAA